ncbi:MAG TPA: cyclic nucleotide-binding domain-containing protein, partial [Pyrinomonadaceae bacterium]
MLILTKREANESSNGSAAELTSDSSISEVRGFSNLKLTKYYKRGSVLFVEGQRPKGVYVLCAGRAKVSITSAEGKKIVLRIAQPGEMLGINATLRGQPYGATAETLERCRINFISRDDLFRLLDRDKKAYLGVAQSLGNKLSGVIEHARLVLLPQTAGEKLARLLLRWCDELG